jgi:UDP-N-acetylmuramoylalanine--D-glutamate ligase
MKNDRYNFSGKKVLIMGLGRFGGGVDCAQFASKAGAEVIVTDSAPAEKLSDSIDKLKEFPDIEFHLCSHHPEDFKQSDIIIANPAVPEDNEFLEIACNNNKFITSQINIFFELCPAQIIGITGANGKSTTTALTAHILKNTSSKKVWLGGNIGNQPLLTILDKINSNDLVVLELSSFQLEQLSQILKSSNVALLTNLTPNHLDRHGTFENYCAAKENIFKYQKLIDSCPAVSIFNAEDKIAAQWFEKYSRDSGRICIKYSSDDVSKEIRNSFKLPGKANLSNLAAAIAISRHFGIDDEYIKKSLPEFKSLPHRLEFIAETNGVSWYNDSIATTPQSTIVALEAFEQPKIIIAGGYDKDLPFDELGKKIAASAKAAVLLGQTANNIASAIKLSQQANVKIQTVNSLSEAVESAANLAESGDVVLLSPACASYDMFENFQQRGNEFTKLVRKLNNKNEKMSE